LSSAALCFNGPLWTFCDILAESTGTGLNYGLLKWDDKPITRALGQLVILLIFTSSSPLKTMLLYSNVSPFVLSSRVLIIHQRDIDSELRAENSELGAHPMITLTAAFTNGLYREFVLAYA